jgi:hypothetical protein
MVEILPPLPTYGLVANEVENDRYIRCIAFECPMVFDKWTVKFEEFETHMHVHEMAEALADGEDYLPGDDDGR